MQNNYANTGNWILHNRFYTTKYMARNKPRFRGIVERYFEKSIRVLNWSDSLNYVVDLYDVTTYYLVSVIYISVYLLSYIVIWLNIRHTHTHTHIYIYIYIYIYNGVTITICLSVHLSICPSVHLSICPSVHLSICLSVYLSICLSICLSVYLSICLSVYLSICLSVYLSICLSVYLSICLSVYLSICLSVYLSICKLQKLQNRAARIITRAGYEIWSKDILSSLNWCDSKSTVMYKIINGIAPSHLSEIFVHVNETHDHNLQSSKINLTVPLPQTEYLKRNLSYSGSVLWNGLPWMTKNVPCLRSFNNIISTYSFFIVISWLYIF